MSSRSELPALKAGDRIEVEPRAIPWWRSPFDKPGMQADVVLVDDRVGRTRRYLVSDPRFLTRPVIHLTPAAGPDGPVLEYEDKIQVRRITP